MIRDFQQAVKNETYQAWHEGAIDVGDTMATGAGKTFLFCNIAQEFDAPCIAVAHRQELVAQAAMAFNREHVPHSIIAPKAVIQQVIAAEHDLQGYSTYNSRAPIRVAGVDTLIRADTKDRWFSQVKLGIFDEGHHVLRANKWGRARLMIPNARGLHMTAHLVRADGQGLGRDAAGFIDRAVIGPHGRALINRGYLTDYRLFCVGSDVDFDDIPVGAGGELNREKLRARTHESKRLVGDIVQTYLRIAPGKLGVTFVVDKEEAIKVRNAYAAAGVPAEVITDETPINVRAQLMRKFRNRQILQLVSVDCLGEGVDVPAIEVVSLGRRTASWQLLCQQVGRSLRPMIEDAALWAQWNNLTDDERVRAIAMSTKPTAIIIDHVGNIVYHAKFRGLPDSKQEYSLLKTERGARKSDAIPIRACLKCFKTYETILIKCPYCNTVPEVQGRSTPELVEGDLVELDAKILNALRGEAARVMAPFTTPFGVPSHAIPNIMRRHHERYTAQESLRRIISGWHGWQQHARPGIHVREAQKLFYIRYGVDVLSAQALNATDATVLEARIQLDLTKAQVTIQ